MCASKTGGKAHGGSRSSVVFLDKEKRLVPGPNHAGQKHQEKSVRLLVNWSLDLPMKDDELLSQERVFRDQFRFPPEKIGECASTREVDGGLTQHRKRFWSVWKLKQTCCLMVMTSRNAN